MSNSENENSNWKANLYVSGTLVGAVIGLLAAHFYAQATEETHQGKRPTRVSSGETIKVLVAILSLIRQITELGGTGKKDKRDR